MEWLSQVPQTTALVTLLSVIFLIQSQVHCLHIRPQQCFNTLGDVGTCMFVWECIKTEGKHLGTCADGFLFGSCCAHSDSKNSIIPSVEAPTSTESHRKPTTSVSPVTERTSSSSYSLFTDSYSLTSKTQNSYTMPSHPNTKPHTRPTYLKPTSTTFKESFTRPFFKPSTTTTFKPSFIRPSHKPSFTTIKPTFIRPSHKPSSTTLKPSFSRPSHKPSSTTFRPSFSRPSHKPSSSTFQPSFSRPSDKPSSSTFKPSFGRPSHKPSSTTSRPLTIRTTTRSPTTLKPNFKPTSRPTVVTFKPTIIKSTTKRSSTTFKNTFTRPTPASSSHTYKPAFTTPTTKASTEIDYFTNVYQPLHPDHNSSSTKVTTVTRTTVNPFLKPTTPKYGYSSTVGGWIYPSTHETHYSSTKQPNYSTKNPTTHRPSVTYWTSKYPYFRPSWKPTLKPTLITSTSNPFIYTYSTNNYTTRPSFTPFTAKVSHSTSYQSPTLSRTTVKFTIPIVNTTTPSYKPEIIVTGNTWKPIIDTTQRTSSFIHQSTTPSTMPTTSNPPSFSTTSGYPQSFSTTHSWIFPSVHKSTVTAFPTTISSTSQGNNVMFPNISVQEIFTTENPQHSVKTFSPITVTTQYSSEKTLDPLSNTPTKTTTPLPVTPCGMPIPHPQKKVVGGKNSAFGSWPWQASVRRTSFFGFSSTHRCGGALISREWVATAGHCVDDLLLGQIKIRVGEYDFASVQEPHGYVERGAKKKVVHPRYNFFTYENDLALVQLEEAIDPIKHPHIAPICLPPNEENLVGRNATVTGWGRLSEGGVLPSILQEVQVPIISNEKCKNMFLAAGRHEYIPDIFMCAGFEEGGRDSCQGDSGGPLQIQTEEGYWFLAGIISWGIGCAEPNMPGVCTRISKFKDWVVQQIM